MAGRHKKPKKRYWIGVVAGTALIIGSALAVISTDIDTPQPELKPADSSYLIERPYHGFSRGVWERPVPQSLHVAERIDTPDRLDLGAEPEPEPEPVETPPEPEPDPEPEPVQAESAPEPEPVPEEAPVPEPEPEPTVVGQMFTTEALRIRSGPGTDSDILAVVHLGGKVDITGNTEGEWAQIIHDGTIAWVHGDYLSETKPVPAESAPEPPAPKPSTLQDCPKSSVIPEAGLTPDALRVARCVVSEFPTIKTVWGVGSRSGSSDHPSGRAVDFMIPSWQSDSGKDLGWALAGWVKDRAGCLGVTYIIWRQQIWNTDRASSGWRWMEDRGSATANHYDHVHVSVHGNAGHAC